MFNYCYIIPIIPSKFDHFYTDSEVVTSIAIKH